MIRQEERDRKGKLTFPERFMEGIIDGVVEEAGSVPRFGAFLNGVEATPLASNFCVTP
jgi:hypothetical protein